MVQDATFTYELNNDNFLVSESYGFSKLSIILISGEGTVLGQLKAGVISSTPLNLQLNTPILFTSISDLPLNGLLIQTTGVIQIIAK